MTPPVVRHEILVWDPLLRALHGWNALTLFTQVVTGLTIEATTGDAKRAIIDIHAISGYAFAAGLATRLLWLVVGPATASWRDLLPLTPKQRQVLAATLRSYLSGLRRPVPAYFGHNPLAALAYLFYFVVAAGQVTAGVILLGLPADQRDDSPLMECHETGFLLLIAFVAVHVLAVAVHQLHENKPLARSMISGRKSFSSQELQEAAGLPGVPPQATPGENQ